MTDEEIAQHWRMICKTQEGIIAFAKAAAQVLAEAGRASNKATGDPVTMAIQNWGNIIIDEALRLHRAGFRKLEIGNVMEQGSLFGQREQGRLRHRDGGNAGDVELGED